MTAPTESDGFVTVTPMNTGRRWSADYERAAFTAWQHAHSAAFYLLQANRHGDGVSLKDARDRLAKAVDAIDAALGAADWKATALRSAREERRAGE